MEPPEGSDFSECMSFDLRQDLKGYHGGAKPDPVAICFRDEPTAIKWCSALAKEIEAMAASAPGEAAVPETKTSAAAELEDPPPPPPPLAPYTGADAEDHPLPAPPPPSQPPPPLTPSLTEAESKENGEEVTVDNERGVPAPEVSPEHPDASAPADTPASAGTPESTDILATSPAAAAVADDGADNMSALTTPNAPEQPPETSALPGTPVPLAHPDTLAPPTGATAADDNGHAPSAPPALTADPASPTAPAALDTLAASESSNGADMTAPDTSGPPTAVDVAVVPAIPTEFDSKEEKDERAAGSDTKLGDDGGAGVKHDESRDAGNTDAASASTTLVVVADSKEEKDNRHGQLDGEKGHGGSSSSPSRASTTETKKTRRRWSAITSPAHPFQQEIAHLQMAVQVLRGECDSLAQLAHEGRQREDEALSALWAEELGQLTAGASAASTATILSDERAYDEAKLRSVFDHTDRDGDGEINVREMLLGLRHDKHLCSLLHLPAHIKQEGSTRMAFERVFQSMDTDSNRNITFEQFKNHIYGYRRSLSEQHAGFDSSEGMRSTPAASGSRIQDKTPALPPPSGGLMILEDDDDDNETRPRLSPAKSPAKSPGFGLMLLGDDDDDDDENGALRPPQHARAGVEVDADVVAASAPATPAVDKRALPVDLKRVRRQSVADAVAMAVQGQDKRERLAMTRILHDKEAAAELEARLAKAEGLRLKGELEAQRVAAEGKETALQFTVAALEQELAELRASLAAMSDERTALGKRAEQAAMVAAAERAALEGTFKAVRRAGVARTMTVCLRRMCRMAEHTAFQKWRDQCQREKVREETAEAMEEMAETEKAELKATLEQEAKQAAERTARARESAVEEAMRQERTAMEALTKMEIQQIEEARRRERAAMEAEAKQHVTEQVETAVQKASATFEQEKRELVALAVEKEQKAAARFEQGKRELMERAEEKEAELNKASELRDQQAAQAQEDAVRAAVAATIEEANAKAQAQTAAAIKEANAKATHAQEEAVRAAVAAAVKDANATLRAEAAAALKETKAKAKARAEKDKMALRKAEVDHRAAETMTAELRAKLAAAEAEAARAVAKANVATSAATSAAADKGVAIASAAAAAAAAEEAQAATETLTAKVSGLEARIAAAEEAWAAERARFAVEKKEMSKKNRKAQMQAASMEHQMEVFRKAAQQQAAKAKAAKAKKRAEMKAKALAKKKARAERAGPAAPAAAAVSPVQNDTEHPKASSQGPGSDLCYLRNFPTDGTDEQIQALLKNALAPYGTVASLNVKNIKRGIVLARFASSAEAAAAVRACAQRKIQVGHRPLQAMLKKKK